MSVNMSGVDLARGLKCLHAQYGPNIEPASGPGQQAMSYQQQWILDRLSFLKPCIWIIITARKGIILSNMLLISYCYHIIYMQMFIISLLSVLPFALLK